MSFTREFRQTDRVQTVSAGGKSSFMARPFFISKSQTLTGLSVCVEPRERLEEKQFT